MTIRTATGKELGCDMAVESMDPERLYIHLTDKTLMEAMAIFIQPSELPIEGWPQYKAIDSIYAAPSGTNLTLKKG